MAYKQLDLTAKVAIVVGGSSGIGKTIALGLAQAGADVVASARRMELVQALADEIESLGRRSLSCCSPAVGTSRRPETTTMVPGM